MRFKALVTWYRGKPIEFMLHGSRASGPEKRIVGQAAQSRVVVVPRHMPIAFFDGVFFLFRDLAERNAVLVRPSAGCT